ncbi:uncharacterized protein MELLADRAFT_86874 [Melampsora larici-populina 98AG31]|uniref:Uncharacterized protein n=1 Tax=Melampsora larici-populina (strain 98AG31 / pathotype 3-4-7) TaxID=747676 RepID=F4R3P7_MELLP|nr:uncharacterized protein MELLADRAFT_86874 [Melampsora larici-populina 98AG31]EGG13132.1 hypothetical protein MELLADRAFT_86874 [Melampsora larici-populina 98AG31]
MSDQSPETIPSCNTHCFGEPMSAAELGQSGKLGNELAPRFLIGQGPSAQCWNAKSIVLELMGGYQSYNSKMAEKDEGTYTFSHTKALLLFRYDKVLKMQPILELGQAMQSA